MERLYEAHASEAALFCEGEWLTFEETARLASGVAALLADAGAAPGDRVVVALANSAVARLVDQALLGFGLVRVALSPRLHAKEIAQIASDAEAAVVCCPSDRRDEVQRALRAGSCPAAVVALDQAEADIQRIGAAASTVPPRSRPQPSDSAMLMYSSGTTGDPKGVVITHESWMAQLHGALAHLPRITNSDLVVLAAPMAHFGGSIALDCLVQGARTVMLDAFDPATVVDAVAEHGATVLPLVPTLLRRLVDEVALRPDAVWSLRAVPYGGSPAPVAMLLAAARCFPGTLTQFYGLAEALAPLTVLTPGDHDRALRAYAGADGQPSVLESAGRWVAGVEHREEGGRIAVRGSVVMTRYWNNPALTTAALHDGWFETGDVGTTDEDGYLRIVGRRSDVIISGGYNIHPREVERAIEGIGGIAEVAVVGLPDARWGEGVHAFVVLSASSRFAEPESGARDLDRAVREACLRSIASFKKPVGVHVIGAIPRNVFGKVDRAALRRTASTTIQSQEKEQP